MTSASNNSGSGNGQNQGEGDKKSAKRYNDMQKDFVSSERGRKAIDQAGDLSEQEQREAEKAEEIGRSHAKGEDPAVRRGPDDSPKRD